MVFYGRKINSNDKNNQDYPSIKDEILKELGQRITPVEEKSIASIFHHVGDTITFITQQIINLPQVTKEAVQYQQIQNDMAMLKRGIQPIIKGYRQIPEMISRNKTYILQNFTCRERMIFLNASLVLLTLLSLRKSTNFSSKFQALTKTFIIGYPLGGVLIVPQIYNPLFVNSSSKII